MCIRKKRKVNAHSFESGFLRGSKFHSSPNPTFNNILNFKCFLLTSLSLTISWSLPKFVSIESVTPSSRVFSSTTVSSKASINSLALCLLHGPALTSVHDYWKDHSFDQMKSLGAYILIQDDGSQSGVGDEEQRC